MGKSWQKADESDFTREEMDTIISALQKLGVDARISGDDIGGASKTGLLTPFGKVGIEAIDLQAGLTAGYAFLKLRDSSHLFMSRKVGDMSLIEEGLRLSGLVAVEE